MSETQITEPHRLFTQDEMNQAMATHKRTLQKRLAAAEEKIKGISVLLAEANLKIKQLTMSEETPNQGDEE